MKHAKRFAAVLLAILLLAALAVPGMADPPENPPEEPTGDARAATVNPNISNLGLTETLTVGDYCYLPEITYTLTLGSGDTFLWTGFGEDDDGSGEFYMSYGFNAAVSALEDMTLGTVVFGSTAFHDALPLADRDDYPYQDVALGDYTLTYVLDDDTVDAINALEFDRACVLIIPIIKTVDVNVAERPFGTVPTADNPTNYNHSETEDTGTALVIFVPGTAGGPGTPVVGVYAIDEDNDQPTFDITGNTMGTKIEGYEDEYEPEVKNLTIGKTVTGSLGDYDRYFRFDVTLYGSFGDSDEVKELKVRELIANGYLNPTGDDSVAEATTHKYSNEDFEIGFSNRDLENGDKLDFTETNAVTFTFWLKHGETITIENIPDYVNYYSVYEESLNYYDYIAAEGYTTSYVISVGEEAGTPVESSSACEEDWDDTDNRTVDFTNERDVNTPTGVTLQAAAPIAGVVVALGLGAVVLLGKKRRRNGSDA